MSPLNEDQQALVEGVVKLVYHFSLRHRGPSRMEIEDYQSALMLAVVRAAGLFDPALGGWVPYAYKAMRLERSTLLQLHAAIKRGGDAVTVGDVGGATYGDREASFLDSLPGREKCPFEVAVDGERAELVEAAIEQLGQEDPRALWIIQSAMKGSNGSALARRRGITRRTARNRLNRALTRLKEITVEIGKARVSA